jgi:hypothetical protein
MNMNSILTNLLGGLCIGHGHMDLVFVSEHGSTRTREIQVDENSYWT